MSALFVSDEFEISKYMTNADRLQKITTNKGFFQAGSVKKQDWYQNSLNKDGEVYWFNLPETPARLYMGKMLKYQVVNNSFDIHKYNIGVLVLGFDVSWLSNSININAMTKGTNTYLTDDMNTVFYSNEPSFIGEKINRNLAGIMNSLKDGSAESYPYTDSEFFIKKNILLQGLTLVTVI